MLDFYYAERQARNGYAAARPHSCRDARNGRDTIRLPRFYLRIRRAAEVLAIIVTAPATLVLCSAVAALVAIDSPGPVIFRQRRPGSNGEVFEVLKFRTMWAGSHTDTRLTDLHDRRVTRIGAFLRRHRLDELPQIWNVLRGDMSLIGPRPDPIEHAERYERLVPDYRCRYVVRPGITGWAQVCSGYAYDLATTRLKLDDDLYYIMHISPWLDLMIVVRTLRIMISGRGAR